MNTNDNVIKKLEYLGLDLENIPEKIKRFEPLEYRPSKFGDEHKYKVYKYINVCDIEILLTKTNRLSPVTEKYGKAVPLCAYLNPNEEENIERYTSFLSMVSSMDISKIEELEDEQKKLINEIPFRVKYKKDYLWQIFYSESTNKYFMLVPTEDLDQSAFFYVLKKQLQNQNEKIFVPINYMNYTRDYLTASQISDIENYLWLFTKDWPLVYEVYDKKDNISLQIIGKANIFDDIQSDYKIVLKDDEESIKFYKLLKAVFIMQTEMPHHFKFNISIDKKGGLELNINNKKIIYEILPSIIKEEYLKAEEERIKLTDKKIELEKELAELQKKSTKLEREYLDKEKQITTYLECKKTFFGRVKYFLKYKKVNLVKQVEPEENKQEVKIIRLNKYGEVKSNYTLEELIETYKQIDKEEYKEKNLIQDINAIKHRITNLENKVANATLYIQEIDKHKKSIFEFWKFTNKDKQEALPEGEIQTENKEKLKKTFNFELDFEDLAENLDNKQRELLSKQELDSIYLTSTEIINDINDVIDGKEITEERLETLKEKAFQEKELFDNETFDIFGGISYDNKLNNLANQKHREAKKELFSILPITKHTNIEQYKEMISESIKNLETAIKKINMEISLSVYKGTTEDSLKSKYNKFSILATETIQDLLNEDINTVYLYKINLNENTNILAFTNSTYYENTNKTLPLGMNVEKAVLLDLNSLKIELKEEKQVNIVCFEDPEDELSNISVKQLNIKEFNIV